MLRNDFVSNSSSSSFIVIGENNIQDYDYHGETISVPTTDGCCQFGWEFAKYEDFWSKLNFCALQIIELKSVYEYAKEITEKENKTEYDKNWLKWHNADYLVNLKQRLDDMTDMLITVCREKFNLNIEIRNDIGYGDDQFFAYIDHQSSASDGANMEMFDSEYNLTCFLASTDSYIKTGNDNSDCPDGWYDK